MLSRLPNSEVPSALIRTARCEKLILVVVGMLAMGGALFADYYMDDYLFVLNPTGTAPAEFKWHLPWGNYGSQDPGASYTSLFQFLPTLLTLLTGALFPLNPIASHAWNLLIHLGLSLLVFRAGYRLLDNLALMGSPLDRRRAAWIGALLFACHPLATEPVHYAKCHMVQLVALFGFWASCEAVSFFTQPNRKSGLRLLLASGLCVVSYFPGTVMLGLNLLGLLLFSQRSQSWKRRHSMMPGKAAVGLPRTWLVIVFGVSVMGYLGYYFLNRFVSLFAGWADIYPLHVVTQGRVFWEYLQRMVIPVGLASDHFQPWSTFRDPEGVIKLVLFVGLIFGTGVMALRKGSAQRRGWSLLAFLTLIPFAMRLLYVNMEIMVEYRAYNALPWFCLLGGGALVTLAGKLPARDGWRWVPTAGLIGVFTVLSAQRGQVWRSAGTLAEDSLKRYPLNNRGRLQLQIMDLRAGDYLSVLQLHEEALEARERINELNIANQGRVWIDPIRSNLNWIASYQFAVYARAGIEGNLKALQYADQSIATIKQRLPASFEPIPGQEVVAAGPLLEAREKIAGKVLAEEKNARLTSQP